MYAKFSIQDSIRCLKHHQYWERILLKQLAALLPAIGDWPIKQAIGLHVWQDAVHVDEMKIRLKELRAPRTDKEIHPDADRVRQWLTTCPSHGTLLLAIYRIVKPRLAERYRQHAESLHPVQDAPTLRLVAGIAGELDMQCDAMRELIGRSADLSACEADKSWLRAFGEALPRLFDLAYDEPGDNATEPWSWPWMFPPVALFPSPIAARPARFRINDRWSDERRPAEEDIAAWAHYDFKHFVQEMQAAETIASLIHEIEGMPWEFYSDLARHLWDEVRHSTMGEVRLREWGIPLEAIEYSVVNYAWRQRLDPVRRYTILTFVLEAGAFPVKYARHKAHAASGDFLSAQAYLYDITDETMHVKYGHKWVPELMVHYRMPMSKEALIQECKSLVDGFDPTAEPSGRANGGQP